ncbi:AmmeMemoRadiSam system protein B [Zunongwangia sp. F363]|uniref:AmmeMemoRadiSam system protein B n=1 Tax=Autumnicola tepida TaxID=3075595 RepID=A0ABU3CCV4_9FLAO|nr:AmmeMemoRadiSam system protein B [Zunongwangia sp. F363]MDT0644113.1 AmmeMemoRadiSam system protein B [Zunongwangia sp. F363]
MKTKKTFLLFLKLILLTSAYNLSAQKIRTQTDTIGFAQYKWQMDSIFSRMADDDKLQTDEIYKAVISPHDDYSYAAGLYNKTLAGIKANTIILVGVAHKARNFDLQDKIIFGSYQKWKSPYGNIEVSPIREKLIQKLPPQDFMVHDSMIQTEHALEAITPFLSKNNPDIEIVPLLVPYMKYSDMRQFAGDLAGALYQIMQEENLQYGKDVAVVISTDAIHYGDEDWGGSNLARYGTDSLGTAKARQKDLDISKELLSGTIDNEKIKDFTKATVQEKNYKEYKWTWCGRYSVPFGLLLANNLNLLLDGNPLYGKKIDYRSSIHNPHIEVKDIGMGTTAPANTHHWVGYVGMAYE